jgi:hypothetical protein
VVFRLVEATDEWCHEHLPVSLRFMYRPLCRLRDRYYWG